MKKIIALIACFLFVCVFLSGCAENGMKTSNEKTKLAGTLATKLAVLWTSGDPDVAHKVCFMYTHSAKKAKWFDTVELIVWGPSSKLLSEDQQLQQEVKQMLADGVIVEACKACADSYGVSDKLSSLGINVKYMGQPLTDMLKSPDWQVLTF